jgi:hypothetical protein
LALRSRYLPSQRSFQPPHLGFAAFDHLFPPNQMRSESHFEKDENRQARHLPGLLLQALFMMSKPLWPPAPLHRGESIREPSCASFGGCCGEHTNRNAPLVDTTRAPRRHRVERAPSRLVINGSSVSPRHRAVAALPAPAARFSKSRAAPIVQAVVFPE